MPFPPKSLPRICVALGFPAVQQLGSVAESEYKDGNNFLEFRLDYLASPFDGINLISTLSEKYPDLRLLATCRLKANAGGFEGPITAQLEVLKAAAQAGAVALDLEVESAELVKSSLADLRAGASLIISYHNFHSTPSLESVLKRLRRIPADAYKIVTTARKPADNLRIINFAGKNAESGQIITFAMSQIGMPTRVLGPALGSLFTYASPMANEGTAPGQVSSKAMRSLYRCEKLGRQTRIYGVIADPVAHSKSPLIHNRAFHSRRTDAVYLPFLVSAPQLGEWMKVAEALRIAGFSVTIPHKQRIMRYLDLIDPLAKRIGAVNTVWRKGGKWRGTNTDVQGVLEPLGRYLRPSRSSILVAGYGGASRAAALALADAGARVTVTGRNLKSAQALARAAKGNALALDAAEQLSFDALIHATPVGMFPRCDESVFQTRIPADLVFDMVYNPRETLLLQRAAQQGCNLIHGTEMFLEQAARQFEIWTGETAPRAVMQSALEGAA